MVIGHGYTIEDRTAGRVLPGLRAGQGIQCVQVAHFGAHQHLTTGHNRLHLRVNFFGLEGAPPANGEIGAQRAGVKAGAGRVVLHLRPLCGSSILIDRRRLALCRRGGFLDRWRIAARGGHILLRVVGLHAAETAGKDGQQHKHRQRFMNFDQKVPTNLPQVILLQTFPSPKSEPDLPKVD